jgi:hypothetical protein
MYLSPRSFINQTMATLNSVVAPTTSPILARGYQPLYHMQDVNRCPGCGRSHWHVGRSTAECAFCQTALPLALVAAQPMAPRFTTRFSETAARVH